MKVNEKVILEQATKAKTGVEEQIYSFLTSALDEVGGI
jgi:hypothetical protein